ncbi:MAG: LysR family transcriptional regulator [Lactobacillus sp.]|nr:LysR family transcriptional regulator [Lactobacillus sp.]
MATQLNYTDAAERLFRSQSTVSKQIQTLEKELKVELIDRTHRQISLTSAGKVILPFAKKLLVDQQELCEALATHQLQHGMKLKI